MKAISADVVLSGASTRADNSLSLRFSTAELQPSEKTAFFELLNQPCRCVIQPLSDPADGLVEVKAPLGMKTASQRLRSVLYVLWTQTKPEDPFSEFYERKMENYIEKVKAQLAPE